MFREAVMKRRSKAVSLSLSMANLTLASCETLARRTMLIAQNKCSQEEYQRMLFEKAEAATESAMIFICSGGLASIDALMEPWKSRVTANAKRLRKK
jgi:hypothetical protein